MRKSVNDEAESSVRLDFPMESQAEAVEIRNSNNPQSSVSYVSSEVRPTGLQKQTSGSKAAPEKKILLFAVRLALLEKTASGLGAMAFVWATVVLLGGFAVALESEDFWFVTIILVIESNRIFSRSHELEWQHETTLSMADFKKDAKQASFRIFKAGRFFFASIFAKFSATNVTQDPQKKRSDWGRRALKRSRSASDFPLAQFDVSQNVSRLLFWAQLLSASTCISMSVWRLTGQQYGEVTDGEVTDGEVTDSEQNGRPALNVFYGLAVAEAFLFLVEKAYWQWKIKVQKLLARVKDEFGFDDKEVGTLRRFFYDAYSRCLNGSVFDGLKMDLVAFSVDLLKSSTHNGQLPGARVLSALVYDARFAEETLRSIGVMQDVVERLLEMLNWKNRHEQEIRKAVAEIVCSLVKKNRNSLRVAQIPGALESIASLLYESTPASNEPQPYDYSGFSLLGLRILKNLARDHGNRAKIGSTQDLLPKIILFTDVHAAKFSKAQIKTLKLSLQVLKMLAACKGETGNVLRKDILKNVFTISNLREFLLYEGSSRLQLQILAIETLSSLALEAEGRERIGSTGGVLGNLLSVFFMERINTNDNKEMRQLVSKAGEALTLLALDNNHNCQTMIKLKLRQHRSGNGHVIRDLIGVLNDPLQGVHAARILRNLSAYADTDCDELTEITEAAAQVLKLVMEEQGSLQEAAIGLAAQIFKFFNKSSMDSVFNEAAITKRSFVMRLTEVLQRHPRPSIKVPNIRRYCIELVICMVEKDKAYFLTERIELEGALARVGETTSEMENFRGLSGSIGLTRHHNTIRRLVNTALALLSP